ncbi:MAG TPA: ferrochelatase [Acidimicrobiales bacterium]|nr:ferrochelatase [Acidimicrobiales bacterium]
MTATGVLVMAHGTPRTPGDLAAFYTEIRRGSPPPPALLADLERRYQAIGGLSPLNERTAAQLAGIARALEEHAPGAFRVAGGAKFADPRIEDAVAELAGAGATPIVGLVLAPHFSRASVGEYARRARAAAASAPGAPALHMIEHWHLTPGFIALVAARVDEALGALPDDVRARADVLFSAHSVPARLVEEGDPYAEQVRESARAVAAEAGLSRWSVVWQSAGRTADAWIGPDVRDAIESSAGAGSRGVVVCPIGFVSDHLEVLYDIDIEAAAVARRAGLAFARTASLNDDPRFCDVLADVVRRAVGA